MTAPWPRVLAVATLAWTAIGSPAEAQNSTAERPIFNDVFLGQPAPAAFVVLAEGTVYRFEVEPAAAASISVRAARRPGAPPLFLVPLSESGTPSGAASFLLVPRESEEYRLDVLTQGNEPVRVRIWIDPRENARWARIREASRGQRPAGVSTRLVYLGPFARQRADWGDTLSILADGTGLEACFAVLPRGSWIRGPFGGCAASVTFVRRREGNAVFLSTNPAMELTAAGRPMRLAATLHWGLGTTVQTRFEEGQIDYSVQGVSLDGTLRVPGTRGHLDAEAALGGMRIATANHDSGFLALILGTRGHLVLYASAGVRFNL